MPHGDIQDYFLVMMQTNQDTLIHCKGQLKGIHENKLNLAILVAK